MLTHDAGYEVDDLADLFVRGLAIVSDQAVRQSFEESDDSGHLVFSVLLLYKFLRQFLLSGDIQLAIQNLKILAALNASLRTHIDQGREKLVGLLAEVLEGCEVFDQGLVFENCPLLLLVHFETRLLVFGQLLLGKQLKHALRLSLKLSGSLKFLVYLLDRIGLRL